MIKVNAYYSIPVELSNYPNDNYTFSHIKTDNYKVRDVFLIDGENTVFFLVELGDNYVFVESSYGSRSYKELSVLIGLDEEKHNYEINGFFYKTKSRDVSFLLEEINKRYYCNNQIVASTKYIVMPFRESINDEKYKIGIGTVIIILCVIIFIFALKMKKKYFSDSGFWLL